MWARFLRQAFGAAIWVSMVVLMPDTPHAGTIEHEIEQLAGPPVDEVENISKQQIDADSFVPAFYAQRGYSPAWYDSKTSLALFQELERGVSHGFSPSDFRLQELRALYDKAESSRAPADIAQFDVLATTMVARLLDYAIFGKVDPAVLDQNWNFSRTVLKQNPPQVVNDYLSGEGFEALMQLVFVSDQQYLGLVTALSYYRAAADKGGWPKVADDEVLKPGHINEAVEQLRYRLAAEHALDAGQVLPAPPETGESAAWVYDENLATDVKAFQARHGLEADGIIGKKTFQALNRTAEERVDQIRLSLERARWIMRDLGEQFVLVNIAGNRTYVAKDGITWTTRSVTGSQYRKTPVFRDDIQYMEFNPTWTVPNSIFRKDKLAKIRKDPAYLERNGYVVKTREGKVISASSVDWSSANPPVVLMQKPGSNNALGRVKFMFPNKHSVYLHDTDNKALFNRNERNLSSGCVRLEHPFEFANLLMEGQPDWSDAKMQSILDSGKTTRVNLPEPVPVLLTYWTAWVEDDAVHFREDIYERDAAILKALNH